MKKLIALLLCITCIACITGCSSTTENESPNEETTTVTEFELVNDWNASVSEYRDPETGVHYFILTKSVYKGGCGGMCPRYNANGTLYVD